MNKSYLLSFMSWRKYIKLILIGQDNQDSIFCESSFTSLNKPCAYNKDFSLRCSPLYTSGLFHLIQSRRFWRITKRRLLMLSAEDAKNADRSKNPPVVIPTIVYLSSLMWDSFAIRGQKAQWCKSVHFVTHTADVYRQAYK